jgi:hypothetical protein
MKEPKEILKEIEELGEFPKYPERKMGENPENNFLKKQMLILLLVRNLRQRKWN